MPPSSAPPFDPWSWAQAWGETWWAGLDPAGTGRQLRERRLARLIDKALADSPFYRRRQPKAQQLTDFRPTRKGELMEAFDDWATDRRITRAAAQAFVDDPSLIASTWLGDYLLWTSSGTTGVPGLFVQDAASLAAYDAIDALRLRGHASRAAPWSLWGAGQRFAFVGATGGHFAGHVSLERLRRLMPPALAPPVEVVSALEPLPAIAARLMQTRPTVLISYPSAAAALARMQLDAELDLDLNEVWVGGEQLSAPQRQLISLAFGCPIRNNYGASEFYSIATECPLGHLHLNEDWVILEPVDECLRPVPMGCLSDSVLLTNLANLTQPLLRYQLSDRVRLIEPRCACGNAFRLIEVEGRADDTVRLAGEAGRPVTLLPLALETVVEEGARTTHFQLLCHADAVIEVRFQAVEPDAAAAFKRVRPVLLGFLSGHGVIGARVRHGHEAPMLRSGSGKLRRVLALPATRRSARWEGGF
jgi:phenylacetate-coenzyme A ligase PaaK-like adenylate-forming protein